MRPKKVILLYSANPQELSVTTFMLETRGYSVIKAESSEETVRIYTDRLVDLVVIDFGYFWPNATDLARQLKAIYPFTPILLVGDPCKDFLHIADRLLVKTTSTSAELLDVVKVMSSRKRGPRPRVDAKTASCVTGVA